MKYINNILVAGALIFGLSACEKDLPEYETTVCQLNFKYGTTDISTDKVTDEMREGAHSFKLNSGIGVNVDTVWVRVATMGYLSDEARPFELEQVMTGERDAVAGKHYVAFTDAEMQSWYYIPAGQAEVLVPIVVKRDPSLETEGDVVLKFTFKENEYFKLGYPEFAVYSIVISDQLAKPTMWTTCNLNYYFGAYGPVKHELMIAWTEQAWDDTYIESLFYEYRYSGGGVAWYPKDGNYISYLASWFAERLAKENAERLADPEIGDVYREANGDAVDFTSLD